MLLRTSTETHQQPVSQSRCECKLGHGSRISAKLLEAVLKNSKSVISGEFGAVGELSRLSDRPTSSELLHDHCSKLPKRACSQHLKTSRQDRHA